jgi:SAM-dependent methyltransferase
MPAIKMVDALLRWFGPVDVDFDDNDPDRVSKLAGHFGASVFERLAGMQVADFGSGRGADAVAAARRGAHVTGIEIRPAHVAMARRLAAQHRVADRCTFLDPATDRAAYETLAGQFDYVVTVDTFEHFRDPDGALADMDLLLKPGGTVLLGFGPPWFHPYGAHLTHVTRLPWIHLIAPEHAVLESAARRGLEDARSYEEMVSAPNRMTVAQFERHIAASSLACLHLRYVPIRRLAPLTANRRTREYFTALITCELHKRNALHAPIRTDEQTSP